MLLHLGAPTGSGYPAWMADMGGAAQGMRSVTRDRRLNEHHPYENGGEPKWGTPPHHFGRSASIPLLLQPLAEPGYRAVAWLVEPELGAGPRPGPGRRLRPGRKRHLRPAPRRARTSLRAHTRGL